MMKKCQACGGGVLVYVARPGRFTRHRQCSRIEVPADLPLPTCSLCGVVVISASEAKAFDDRMDAEVERLGLGNAQPSPYSQHHAPRLRPVAF